MKIKILEIDTSVMSEFNHFFFTPNHCRCRKEPVIEFEDGRIGQEGEQVVSTQILHKEKSQHIVLQDHMERYSYILPVFGFKNAE